MPTLEHAVKIHEMTLDLDALPDEAQRELVVFYQFLVFKYHHQEPPPSRTDGSAEEPSKWAKLVQRVQNDPVHLAGYAKTLQQDMQEFRENFEFKHDQK